MPYRVPGAYARFIRKASPVNNVGATRVLGIVGTGANYFEVYNEAIKKSDSQSYDKLSQNNVFEIISLTDRALSNGTVVRGTKVFEEGVAYELKDGNKIAWNTIAPAEFSVKAAAPTEASIQLKNQITALVNDNDAYKVIDGEYTLEVSYLESAWDHAETNHVNVGCYRVINNKSKQIVGEWGVSPDWNEEAIPGLKIRIEDVFVPDANGDSITKIGDAVIIETKAPKTEIEATVQFDDSVIGYNQALADSFLVLNESTAKNASEYERFMIVDSESITSGDYELVYTSSSPQMIEINNVSTDFDTSLNPIYSGEVGTVAEYLNIIPGVTFILNEIDESVNVGDTVGIHVTAPERGEAIAEDDVYYVSYKYKKAETDYDPILFYNYDDVIQAYGNYDVTASSVVVNSLTLGAELAFRAGVNPVVCVQAKNDSDYEMKIAIDKLTSDVAGAENVNIVVPLTTSTSVGSYMMTHVDRMSSEEGAHERMTYLGAYPKQPINKFATAADRTVGMKQQAEGYDDERVVYVVPGRVNYDVKNLQTGRINTRVLPGCYLALGVATIALTQDVAEPLTRKYIRCGFGDLLDLYTETEKNALAESGCCVVEQRTAGIRCRHGITTKDDEVNTTEITLIQIKDYVIAQCRKSCDALYIGIKNLPGRKADIQYTINSILTQFISQEILLGFQGLTVKDSPDDPREVLVNFEIEAVYPLNYVTITFGFAAT